MSLRSALFLQRAHVNRAQILVLSVERLHYLFGALFDRRSLTATVLFAKQRGIIQQDLGHLRVNRPQRLLLDHKGLFEEWFGLSIAALSEIHIGQAGEREANLRMIVLWRPFPRDQRLSVEFFC